MTRFTILFALLLPSLSACQEQRDDVANAVEAAKGVAELAQNLKKAGEQAQKAGEKAEQQAAADLAAGKDPAIVQQQTELAKNIAAAQALTSGGGPAVNWRKLAPFLPDTIGELKADGDVKGETQKAGTFEHSRVQRRYKAGESTVSISIADGSAMPMLRAPFAMAAMMISEDTSEGYKKGTKIDGNTAVVEWREKSKRSTATTLVGDRFVLNVEVSKTKPEAAEAIVKQMPLAELAKLTPDVAEEEKK
jgi:hypothetical protein